MTRREFRIANGGRTPPDPRGTEGERPNPRPLRASAGWRRIIGASLRSSLIPVMLAGSAVAAQAQGARSPQVAAPTQAEVRAVAPALDRYTQDALLKDMWSRPDLSARDRSLATLAVLVTRNQKLDLPATLDRALDSGVTAAEISELITHLAFYAGWPNAMAAVAAAKPVFAARGIGPDQLPPETPPLLPLDGAAEAKRVAAVEASAGAVSPGLVQNTTDLLFRDLWLRPGLAPRDRSLVTVSALIASGQVAQIPFHLNKAMDNGLTRTEVSGVLAHLAFYTGWPHVFSAVPVVRTVLDDRRK